MLRTGTASPFATGRPLSLPNESEIALLHYLLDKMTCHNVTFKSVCDRRPEVFGTPASDFRRQIQKRRAYLIKHPEVFQNALQALLPKEVVAGDLKPIPDNHSSWGSSSSPLIVLRIRLEPDCSTSER